VKEITMKTQAQIEAALERIPQEGTAYPAMTYEQGVEEALLWVLEEIPNDEFEFADGDV